MLVISRALGRAVGSYEDDMTEPRFPTHVPGNVPGTKVQEHGWEIACASKHGRVLEIWLRECAGPVCEQGPGLSCVRGRVLACAGVSVRERVHTRACLCASVSSAALLRRGKLHIPLLGSGWG